MPPKGKYTAADLARLAGVPVRTVRFYIQEGLVDAPLGRGPGAHFEDRHLHQLRRTRALQGAGLDLPAIKAHASELERILAERGMTMESAGRVWTAFALANITLPPPSEEPEAYDDDDEDEDDDDTVDADTAIRIPMAPGIELMVARTIPLPSPRKLVELAFAVRRLFKPGKETK